MLKMKRRTRVYYTDKQKAFMWERWKQGDSMSNIAALFNRHHTTVQGMFHELEVSDLQLENIQQ